MSANPHDRIKWVARYIIPAEPQVRASLRASGTAPDVIDDLIQDAYCRIAGLAGYAQIEKPAAYFMQTVKNLHRDRLRRDKIIRFEQFTETSDPFVSHVGLDMEAEIGARCELRMVDDVLNSLPIRCREIFRLKRIDGLSQKEIARTLNVTETIVENDVRKAVKALQAVLRGDDMMEGAGRYRAADRERAG
ncbi:RNA polymerase sigma factor [Erythrobacter sp. W302b]|uniref:RNA polymerase sigma factor n=1 Tax=Erythrobacter sp. W302b TaxID=3389874 RepID=UPI00396B0E92